MYHAIFIFHLRFVTFRKLFIPFMVEKTQLDYILIYLILFFYIKKQRFLHELKTPRLKF